MHIELERIYITLRISPDRGDCGEEAWLAVQAQAAPGEEMRRECLAARGVERESVSVNEALAKHDRLVVLGDPGSGKTTLLRYLALLYAGDMATGDGRVREKLGLDESGRLPIYIPLGKVGRFAEARRLDRDGAQGHGVLIDWLVASFRNERIELDGRFFEERLKKGEAAVFMDGLDEVADPKLRAFVSRAVESFVRAHPDCRYAVTSRIVGYTGAARLLENFKIATVRDFSLEDVKKFLGNWHLMAEIGRDGPGPAAKARAARQTRRLTEAIMANERIRELAINPLMLTVIALVHRDRVVLPDRRVELYKEAVDVLLGNLDEAKEVGEIPILESGPFDAGDKRLVLQNIALAMHEGRKKEFSAEELKRHLEEAFSEFVADQREVRRAARRFTRAIEERAGLLAARGEGAYSFSHLTFQEYLAALAVAEKETYVSYTLGRVPDRWWREVILLEAGHLSTQGKSRATRLIRAIADCKEEPEPFHNLVLAAECLRDAGANRVEGNLSKTVRTRLRKGVEKPPPIFTRVIRRFGAKGWVEHRSAAMNALVRIGAGFWSMPWGEPEWVEIPAGEFVMGEGNEKRDAYLDAYAISRTPVTNAQYFLFVKDAKYKAPDQWTDGRPPKGKESHPVVYVEWSDASEYCRWLSEKIGSPVDLPTEAQWERAARGKDGRIYPWGNSFDALKCNSRELGVGDTTPVGIFPEGASADGVLDMAGNVWEWCRDWYAPYPEGRLVNPTGPPERMKAYRVLRGGSWMLYGDRYCRCAHRNDWTPDDRDGNAGFRLARSATL